MPAVGVSSQQFIKLARTVLRSQKVPDTIAIEIAGNPEFVTEQELMRIADEVTAQAVQRLTEPLQPPPTERVVGRSE